MATKTLSITEEAYDRLVSEKRPSESFTDVILRLTARRSLRELADLVSAKEAESLAEAIEQSRAERQARRVRRVGAG
ncbi:MAG: antitoxin VapB family protein [Thermoplasmatota archaeon]